MLRFVAAVVVAAVGIAAVALGTPGAASADNFTFYSNANRDAPWNGPACDESAVLNRISAHFDQAEAKYWDTGIRMADITQAREAVFDDWDPTIIARRYCNGTAYLTDGKRYSLVYWLRSDQGFAGVGWGVQFCLMGRDQDYAYAPVCKMLRPL